jgi:transcriptional regulator with XRE-family HTH domain
MAADYSFSGKRFREIRERRGMSREELALAVNRGAIQIYRWEREIQLPSPATIGAIARALRVDVEQLYDALEAS